MTTYIDPSVRVTVAISEILSLPRCQVKDRLLTRAARKTRSREAVAAITAEQLKWAHVEAEAHRLNAQADRIYAHLLTQKDTP